MRTQKAEILLSELSFLQNKFPEFTATLETAKTIIKREGKRTDEDIKKAIIRAVQKQCHTVADILDETKLSRVTFIHALDDLLDEKRILKRQPKRAGKKITMYFLPLAENRQIIEKNREQAVADSRRKFQK